MNPMSRYFLDVYGNIVHIIGKSYWNILKTFSLCL